METQPRTGTEPELELRKLLFAEGLRYRVNYPVPGKPRRTIDIAFPGRKVAVFVDGCFWHSCPEHAVEPRHNGGWWREKLARNVARDEETTRILEDQGWSVIRLWEHLPAREAATLVKAAVVEG
ncbi:very short patch repair endonuclease [Propionibacterium australiense]|uniref:Very short patch repair endonuclease n=1 Tax=Propionibacterium australiense TaxID=119981 RepID=A0A8B3FTH6_9ACTN|nr:very short patch repair endonuclease [Propionibacterium australiense]RLP11062.1 very short patch repair endonuclease [Propionibacterium australiense]RLP13126.1 very short patch repair endonuclease [Propionibacterium australiense]VEH91031.1 Very short patch repair protein [Propionibacterium australiense]